MLLKDRTLLVTGAGRGIGRTIVETAVREGAQVVAHTGRRSGADHLPQQVQCLYGDLTVPDDLERIWNQAVDWHGRVDVLVNNAGIYIPSPVNDSSLWEQGWKTNLAINLEAPATLCRHAIQHFQTTGEGIIINMASRSSHRGDDAEHLAYGAANGGLLALTKGIARSFAASGTLAYAIAPAWVRTEMAEAHIATVGEEEITQALPMREITPPTDVAETVVFLASGRARHATGCTIDITGADYVR
ncbi:MAG: SDR family oxidoreductase [Gammaproteobacteria bacterium]|nr:SDR family oxidoreductase [Gammaproteobacteria bacterium]